MKKMRFISLRWRLVLSYALLAVLTVFAVGALALALIRNNLWQRESELMNANARAVAKQAALIFQQGPDRNSLQQLADTAAFMGNAQVRILDQAGTTLVDSGPRGAAQRLLWITPSRRQASDQNSAGVLVIMTPEGIFGLNDPNMASVPWLRALMPEARMYVIRRSPGAFGNQLDFEQMPTQQQPQTAAEEPLPATATRVQQAITVNDSTAGFVEMGGVAPFSDEALGTAQRALLFAAIAALGAAMIAGFLVSRGLTAPLTTLAGSAAQMSQGNFAARAPLKKKRTRDEIDQLSAQFNDMAEKLDASFKALSEERDALRRFIADASHELRTPITSLKLSNELLQGPVGDDPAARADFLAQNEAQLNRLEWITHNLLDLSRLDAGIANLNIAPHDAGDLIDSVALPFKAKAEQKGIELVLHKPQLPVQVNCDLARVEIALSNLIDNALKFTPAGGRVEVSAAASEHWTRFMVQDTGIGINNEEQARVFERFYRGSNHRTEGTGLGLAIVKSITQAHGGRAFVESTPGAGSTFGIELPNGN
jgi:signal transduction histidine kinase